MSDPMDTGDPSPLKLEDVSRAAAELAAEKELDQLLTRFLGRVREWAAPSAVLAAVRDPAAESGWRLLPALSFGSGPLGAERALPGLIEETPGCLERPTLVHPDGPVPGAQSRDNCIVPWTHDGDFGVLVIRGVPRPSAANLGEALALLSAPVWPRLLGSPAARVESLVVDLRRLAESLEADAERQIERLRAAQPKPVGVSAGDEAEVREKLEAARRDAERAAAERDEVKERLLALETALEEAEGERDRARAREEELDSQRQEAQRSGAERDESREALEEAETALRAAEARARASEESLGALRAEVEALRSEGEHSTLEWDELKGRVATLQEALDEAELERDRVRDECERLTARIESMQSEHASALEQSEERRRAAADANHAAEEQLSAAKKELDAARVEMERGSADEDALKGRIALIEEDLQKARSDRDEALAARERLDGERRSASDAARDFEETLASAQRDLESARREQQRAVAEAGEMRARVGSLEATLQEIEAERDGARGQVEILQGEKRVAEATARTAEEALASVRRQLEEAREGARSTAAAAPLPEAVTPERTDRALNALRGTLDVLRRTPFVPPGLRVSVEEGEAVLDRGGEKPERWLRVALLDRDAGSLVPLADELEAAGVDVRIANYPEELALLMKTPDAEHLNVAVCDILAFRADQTVAGLFRGWSKDRPGLAFVLSFNPEDAAESERAKRVPISLTSGRLPRPIPVAELLEKLQVLAKKQGASEA